MPLCLAIAAPVSSRCPRKPASAAFSSATDCTCRFGTTSTWTGAWGLMSSNATARSSSWAILEGIFFSAILQKMQSLICASPVGPDPLAAGPPFFSLATLGGQRDLSCLLDHLLENLVGATAQQ